MAAVPYTNMPQAGIKQPAQSPASYEASSSLQATTAGSYLALYQGFASGSRGIIEGRDGVFKFPKLCFSILVTPQTLFMYWLLKHGYDSTCRREQKS